MPITHFSCKLIKHNFTKIRNTIDYNMRVTMHITKLNKFIIKEIRRRVCIPSALLQSKMHRM